MGEFAFEIGLDLGRNGTELIIINEAAVRLLSVTGQYGRLDPSAKEDQMDPFVQHQWLMYSDRV